MKNTLLIILALIIFPCLTACTRPQTDNQTPWKSTPKYTSDEVVSIAQSRQPCINGDIRVPPSAAVTFLDEPGGIWKVILIAPAGYHFADFTSGEKVLYFYEDSGYLITVHFTSEPVYAYVITRITLLGLNEANLEQYTRYGNDEFKNATLQETLNTIAEQFNENLGDFRSIAFLYAELEDGHTVVHYNGNYARGVIHLAIDFDQNHQVAHNWLY